MTGRPPLARLEATIVGRVQGVGFRYFVVREAMALDLDGWVANQSDGSVRCVAEGPPEHLDRLLDQLREGPASATIERVDAAWMPATGTLERFRVQGGAHRGD